MATPGLSALKPSRFHPGPHALVLGMAGLSRLIGGQLERLGFSVEPVGERSSAPVGEPPGALVDTPISTLDQLKARLRAFAEAGRNPRDLYVHPGVSLWAERGEFPLLCQELGLTPICPPARVITLFANKLNLFSEAERLGIGNLLISLEPVHSPREIERLMERAGKPFPFVLKAVRGGGGGFGRYVVREGSDLGPRLTLWMEQLRRQQGEVMLIAERYVEGARYLVQPFARFADARFEAFPIVDASLQSRFRKIAEFCPADHVDPETRAKLGEWARALAENCGYVGVGALELMVDGPKPYLVEALPRLDTGFHLWERVAGVDAVEWQLAALEDRPFSALPERKPVPEWTAALALRLYAEDSVLQLPQPGRIHEISESETWSFPGATADRTRVAGAEVAPDSGTGLIGILWVGARDRPQAMGVARGLLEETWVAGTLQTNERFLSELLAHPWVKAGHFHAGFVDEEFLPPVRPPEQVFRLLGAVAAEAAMTGPAGPGSEVRWIVGDQVLKPQSSGMLALDWVAPPARPETPEGPGLSGSVRPSLGPGSGTGRVVRVAAYPLGPDRWQARVGSWAVTVRRVRGRPTHPRVLALVPGRVHCVLFREGAVVPAHEIFLIVESLGMLVPHALPRDARVRKWWVAAEDRVSAGQELADFEIMGASDA